MWVKLSLKTTMVVNLNGRQMVARPPTLLESNSSHDAPMQFMPFTLSNNIITMRVRRSGSHFLVGIQSKNGLNADRRNANS